MTDHSHGPVEQVLESAVGVLGDAIDWQGTGWNCEPWFMFVCPVDDGSEKLAFALQHLSDRVSYVVRTRHGYTVYALGH